jgi:hypothetical protein
MGKEESNTQDFLNLILSDISEADKNLERHDSSFNRRVYIRTLFASIEGSIFFFKSEALKAAEEKPSLYSSGEIAMLREEVYRIDKKGHIRTSQRFSPTSENLLFAIHMFARKFDHDYYLDPLDPNMEPEGGWDAFKQSVKIRNRVVHPKSYSDMIITDEELEIIRKGKSFFIICYYAALPNFGINKKDVNTR